MTTAHLTDEELLKRVWLERNPLTTTDLENQLAERFQAYIDEVAGYAGVIAVLDDLEYSYDAKSVGVAMKLSEDFPKARELLDVLTDFDIDEAKPLRDQLDRLKKFDQVMEDLLEPLQTLTTLATTE